MGSAAQRELRRVVIATTLSDEPQPSKTQVASQPGQFFGKLCVSISLTVILLMLGELAAYLKVGSAPAAKPDFHLSESIYKNEPWAATLWREFKQVQELQYRSYVVWRRAPYNGKTIVIGQDGLRRTFYSQCDSTSYNVWIFGDSALWGTGAPDWLTIPSLLAQRYREHGRKVCVKNYGEMGWVSTQEVVQLMLDLKRAPYKPNLVLFYDGTTDAFLPYQSDEPDAHGNFPIIKRQFESSSERNAPGFSYLRRTNTYQMLDSIAHRFGLRTPTQSAPTLTPDEASKMARKTVDNYVKNVELVDALAARYGFQYAFFQHPTVLVGNKNLTVDERHLRQDEESEHPGSGLLIRTTYALFHNTHIAHFYDLANVLDDQNKTMYADFGHLGPEGNRIVAERIFSIVQTDGVTRAAENIKTPPLPPERSHSTELALR